MTRAIHEQSRQVERLYIALIWVVVSLPLMACDESGTLTTAVADYAITDAQGMDANERVDTGTALRMDGFVLDTGIPDAAMTQPDAAAISDSALAVDAAAIPDMTIVNDTAISGDAAAEITDTDVSDPPTRDAQIVRILADFGISAIRTRFPEADITSQASMYVGAVDFTTALTEAINSFLTDGSDVESPRSLAAEVREGPCVDDDLTERVRCFLNRDTAILELYGSEGFAPENREPIAENWIFVLRAESLSDHIQWAIVDRSGTQATYNYGFN